MPVSGTFLRINGQHKHQHMKGIFRIRNIQYIGIRHMEQFLGDHCHFPPIGRRDSI